jgi:hypothetical protein
MPEDQASQNSKAIAPIVERYSPKISGNPLRILLSNVYVGYGLPHRVLIMGLSPCTIYLQVAINIVDCQ